MNKLPTGIPGFDLITLGGLPEGRATLISGTSGSAKTVFACQFLGAGIEQYHQPGVFVTFEETPEAIRANMAGFGWNIPAWEERGQWAFVDVSPRVEQPDVIAGAYDLSALLVRIENAVRRVGARRVAIDSLGGIFTQLEPSAAIRLELFRIVTALKQMGVTALVTAERSDDHGPISRYGIEEFVTDNVVILRNTLEAEKRRRSLEILKIRGAHHQKGEFPFTINSEQGLVVIPLSAIELKQKSSALRVSSGIPELDQMCGGGFFRDSIILLSGATGTGKTLVTTQFIAGGINAGQRSLLFAFEESRDQLFRNAAGWGIDFEEMERQGLLRVNCDYPEICSLEDHLISIKRTMDEFRPQRVAVDSLSALERVATVKSFREFAIGLTSHIKDLNVAGLFTATSSSLLGGSSITETHISTLTDSIILLRYVEMYGEMRRGLTVLKMRGSSHDKDIREFTIDGNGMHIGKPFRTITGILSGQFTYRTMDEAERIGALFRDDTPIDHPGHGT
ncbi:MAG: circadian clock protein KaiC [Gemmataceae bacterium]